MIFRVVVSHVDDHSANDCSADDEGQSGNIFQKQYKVSLNLGLLDGLLALAAYVGRFIRGGTILRGTGSNGVRLVHDFSSVLEASSSQNFMIL